MYDRRYMRDAKAECRELALRILPTVGRADEIRNELQRAHDPEWHCVSDIDDGIVRIVEGHHQTSAGSETSLEFGQRDGDVAFVFEMVE